MVVLDQPVPSGLPFRPRSGGATVVCASGSCAAPSRPLRPCAATAVVFAPVQHSASEPSASIAGLSAQDLDLQVATGPGVPLRIAGAGCWAFLCWVHFVLRAASVEAPAFAGKPPAMWAALTFNQDLCRLMFVLTSVVTSSAPVPIQHLHPLFCEPCLHSPAMQVVPPE